MVVNKFFVLPSRFCVDWLSSAMQLSRQSDGCAAHSAASSGHGHENHSGVSSHWQLRHPVLALAAEAAVGRLKIVSVKIVSSAVASGIFIETPSQNNLSSAGAIYSK